MEAFVTDKITELTQAVTEFVRERDWEQFHSPKNLSMALSVEVAELMEHFQWLTTEQSNTLDQNKHQQVTDEIADVFIYLIRLSTVLDIDLIAAASQKLVKNREKYPAEIVKGKSAKYTEYE
jgi:dCTP diphosphatase